MIVFLRGALVKTYTILEDNTEEGGDDTGAFMDMLTSTPSEDLVDMYIVGYRSASKSYRADTALGFMLYYVGALAKNS